MSEIRLSTGREIDANCDFVGIDSEGNLSEGYDGTLNPWPSDWETRANWTQAERDELADLMIARWQKFKTLTERPA